MSKKETQEKQWKDDSNQLKKDLKNRPKKVVRQEVDLKFGGQKKKSSQTDDTPSPPRSDTVTDDYYRQKLGL